MEVKDEIEDEEMTLEEFVDKKMGPWDQTSVENMYSLSKKCLNERKNRRPQIKEVCASVWSQNAWPPQNRPADDFEVLMLQGTCKTNISRL